MTLQQLHYIIAVNEYRHFAQAAKACHVTQSTLSSMVQKLEQELDVIIFDRSSQPVKPTRLGLKLIDQAKVILYHASQMEELVRLEKDEDAGDIRLGILSNIAPYILPQLFKKLNKAAPKLKLEASELRSSELLDKLKRAELDMVILTMPVVCDNLIEIPLYTEDFYAYISPNDQTTTCDLSLKGQLDKEEVPTFTFDKLVCPKSNKAMALGESQSQFHAANEEGNTDTLVRIVDANGGFTMIPELHIGLLKRCQKNNIQPLTNPKQSREVALYIRTDFVKERLLNIIIDQIKAIIPADMLNERLKKFPVRL